MPILKASDNKFLRGAISEKDPLFTAWLNTNPFVIEVPVGTVNGINMIFTTSFSYKPNSISVYINGIKEINFVQSGPQTITLSYAPKNTGFTDQIEVTYIKL